METDPNPNRSRHLNVRCVKQLTFLIGIGISSLVFAQEGQEPVFELSPFEVTTSSDRGYISSNAVSAYRINLPIQDVPLQIKVVTKEFLEDVKAINLEEALGYTVGVARDVQEIENGRFTIRGLQAAFPKRNGFRRYISMDMTNVERVEVVKGPASALFGEAQPGGIINYITKKPLTEPRTDMTLTYGSYDYRRILLETTGPLNKDKTLLYRLDASYLDRNDYRDFSYEQRTVIAPLIEWRPGKSTSIKIDFEYTDRDYLPPSLAPLTNLRAKEFFDNLPTEGVFNFQKQAYDNELRPAPASIDPFLRLVRAFGRDDLIPENVEDLYYFRDIIDYIPREWSSTGPDSWHKFEGKSTTIEGSHVFDNGISIRGVASSATMDQSYKRGRPNRVRIWGDGFYRGQRLRYSENEVNNVQMDIVLPLDLGHSRLNFVLGGEYYEDNFKAVEYSNPSRFDTEFYLMNYFADSPIPAKRLLPNGDFDNFGIQEYPLDVSADELELGQNPSRTERATESVYLSTQGFFFKERLKVLAGIRFDKLEQRAYEYLYASGLKREDEPIKEWTPQIGLNFDIIEGLSLYANYSESFNPGLGGFLQLNPDGSVTTDSSKPPELGLGKEVGFKFNLLEGRLSGTVAYFDISKENVTLSLNQDGVQYNILVDDFSKGFEFDVAYEVMAGFQILFGYAWIDSFRNDPSAPDWIQAFESRVPGVPENQATIWGKYKFQGERFEGFSIGAGVQWMDDFRGHQALDDLLLLDGFTKVDLLLSYTAPWLDNKLRIDLFVDNVFDENFYYAGPIPALPRNYKLTVSYKF
jgi:iron complex outermembrane receptor protein